MTECYEIPLAGRTFFFYWAGILAFGIVVVYFTIWSSARDLGAFYAKQELKEKFRKWIKKQKAIGRIQCR